MPQHPKPSNIGKIKIAQAPPRKPQNVNKLPPLLKKNFNIFLPSQKKKITSKTPVIVN
jgi:hypothetical protein